MPLRVPGQIIFMAQCTSFSVIASLTLEASSIRKRFLRSAVISSAPIRKDKGFIFGDYEGIRQSLGITNVDTVLSAAARSGTLCSAQHQMQRNASPRQYRVASTLRSKNTFRSGRFPMVALRPVPMGIWEFLPLSANRLPTRIVLLSESITGSQIKTALRPLTWATSHRLTRPTALTWC